MKGLAIVSTINMDKISQMKLFPLLQSHMFLGLSAYISKHIFGFVLICLSMPLVPKITAGYTKRV